MSEPTKEQIDKWRIEAQVFIENEKQIHSPLDLYMVTLAYIAAKKSDFEEIKTLREQLEAMIQLLRRFKSACSPSDIMSCEQDLKEFLEKQDKENKDEK